MTAMMQTTSRRETTWSASVSPVPNYQLRRTVAACIVTVVLLAATIVLFTAVGAMTGLGGRPAAASEAFSTSVSVVETPTVHVAEPGDSLWSIASTYRGEISRDNYVDALISANGGTEIQAGQAVRLP